MILDESIELKNKIGNIKKMENMSNQHMRSIMQEMALDEAMGRCMYEVLTMEGFLPETLSEGETYEEFLSTMMEDDDIMVEMYKSCSTNESDCGMKMEAWLHEKLVGGQKELDKNNNGEIDASDFEMLRNSNETTMSEAGQNEVDNSYTHFAVRKSDGKIVTGWEYNGLDNDSIKEYVKIDLTDMGLKPSDFTVLTVNGLNKKGLDPFDSNNWDKPKMELSEYDKSVMNRFVGQYGKKRGKQIYYATANKQKRSPETFEKNENELYEGNYPEGEHYKMKISQICDDLADVNRMMDNDGELPAWIQDKIAVMYHSADAIKSYLHGETSGTMNEIDDDDDDSDSPTYLLNKKRILDQEITRYGKLISKFIPMVGKLNISDLTTYFQPESEISIEGFMDFLTMSEDETPVDYYQRLTQTGDFAYRSIFDNLMNPRKRGFFTKYGKNIGYETLENMEDVLSDIFDLSNSIYVKNREIQKIENSMNNRSQRSDDDDSLGDETMVKPRLASKAELDALSFSDDDDDMLEEVSLPVKGVDVDSENKSNAKKSNTESGNQVKKSQETTDQKVDNLKNQKYQNNDWETKTDEVLHGWRNNLDLDYKTGLSKEQAEKIKDEAKGMAPKDHVNVDHDSEAGEKLVNSAKMRSKDDFINKDDYTSKHDRTQIEKGQSYEKTTIFDKLDENVNKDIERLKNLFTYEDKLVNENKKNTTNEDQLLFKQVSKKKFI